MTAVIPSVFHVMGPLLDALVSCLGGSTFLTALDTCRFWLQIKRRNISTMVTSYCVFICDIKVNHQKLTRLKTGFLCRFLQAVNPHVDANFLVAGLEINCARLPTKKLVILG
jgi:hypothetical protein